MSWLSRLFSLGMEIPSPSDIVLGGDIHIMSSPKAVWINLTKLNIGFSQPPTVWIPDIPDTNSMDPSFDYNHSNILIAGADEADHKKMIDFMKKGDIAVCRIMANSADPPSDFSKPYLLYVIHRVVEIGKDKEGRYFKFQGDNNASRDPFKVRDKNILYLCIGTIY